MEQKWDIARTWKKIKELLYVEHCKYKETDMGHGI